MRFRIMSSPQSVCLVLAVLLLTGPTSLLAQERVERVADINPGPDGSNPEPLASIGSTLLLAADDGTHGLELWKTDLSEAGTVLVKDIHAGEENSLRTNSFSPPAAAELGGFVYFVADDGIHGWELWRSDGTEEGTTLVLDILPGDATSYPDFLTPFNGELYFVASERPNNSRNREIWKTDGTAEGTTRVLELNPGGTADPTGLTVIGDEIYFAGDDGTSRPGCVTCLWKTDGTAEGTVLAAEVSTGAQDNRDQRFAHVDG